MDIKKHSMGSEAGWFENAYSHQPFQQVILTCKVNQTDLVFGVRPWSLIGPCKQDKKSLQAALMICATPVNIQTQIHNIHTNTHRPYLISI